MTYDIQNFFSRVKPPHIGQSGVPPTKDLLVAVHLECTPSCDLCLRGNDVLWESTRSVGKDRRELYGKIESRYFWGICAFRYAKTTRLCVVSDLICVRERNERVQGGALECN